MSLDDLLNETAPSPAPQGGGLDALLAEVDKAPAPTPVPSSQIAPPRLMTPELKRESYGLALTEGPLGYPLRVAKALPGAIAASAADTAQLPGRAYEGLRSLVQPSRVADLQQQQAFLERPEVPAPVQGPPVGPQGFRYQFAPTQAGPRATNAPPEVTQAQDVQAGLNRLQPAQEARSTYGFSVARDLAMLGLTAADIPAGGAIAATMNVGIPAAMEATGLNQATGELGQRGAELAAQGLEAADLAFGKDEVPARLNPETGEVLPQNTAEALLLTLVSPEMSQAGFQAGLMGASLRGTRGRQEAPSLRRPTTEAPAGPGEFSLPQSQPSQTSLKSVVADAAAKTPLRPVVDYFTAPDKIMRRDLVDRAIGEGMDQAMAETFADRVMGARQEYRGTRELAENTADAAATRAYEALSQAEQARVGQMLEALPKVAPTAKGGVRPHTGEAVDLARLSTPEYWDKVEGYRAAARQVAEQALGPYDQVAPQTRKLIDVFADLSAQQRLAEDFGGKDMSAVFNYKRTADELAPFNAREAELRQDPSNYVPGPTADRAGGLERLARDKDNLREARQRLRQAKRPMTAERLAKYQEDAAKLQREFSAADVPGTALDVDTTLYHGSPEGAGQPYRRDFAGSKNGAGFASLLGKNLTPDKTLASSYANTGKQPGDYSSGAGVDLVPVKGKFFVPDEKAFDAWQSQNWSPQRVDALVSELKGKGFKGIKHPYAREYYLFPESTAELKGKPLTEIRKNLKELLVTNQALREAKRQGLLESVPPTPDVVKPTKAEAGAFETPKRPPMKPTGVSKATPEGLQPIVPLPDDLPTGMRTREIITEGDFPTGERRPGILPEQPSSPEADRRILTPAQYADEQRRLAAPEVAKLKERATRIKDILNAEGVNQKDLRKLARLDALQRRIEQNKPLDAEQFKMLQDSAEALERRITKAPETAKQYLSVVAELQRNYKQGGRGYMKHLYPEKLSEAYDSLREELTGGGAQKVRGVRQEMRQRTEGFTQRKPEAGPGYLKSPALPMRQSIMENYSLGAFKKFASVVKQTPFVLAPDSPAAAEAMKQGWKQLPDSDAFGDLAGQLVSPEMDRVLNPIKQMATPGGPGRSVTHLVDWLAGGKAAGTMAANVGNTAGMAFQMATDGGVSPHEVPGIFGRGIAGFNHPKYGKGARMLGLQTLIDGKDIKALLIDKHPELAKVAASRKALQDAQAPWVKTYFTDPVDFAMEFQGKLAKALVGEAGLTEDPAIMRRVFRNTEALGRVGYYIWLREHLPANLPEDVAHRYAENRVKETLIDYSEKPQVVKDLETFGLGGVGNRFAQFALQIQNRGLDLATNANPVVAARFAALPAAVGALGYMMSEAYGESDEERQAAETLENPWQKGMNRLSTLPLGKDKDGNWVRLSLTRWNPYSKLLDNAASMEAFMKAEDKGTTLLNGQLQSNMAMQPLLELAANRDAFFGTPIYNEDAKLSEAGNLMAIGEKLGGQFLPDQAPGGRRGAMLSRIERGEDNPDVRTARGLRLKPSDVLLSSTTALRPTTLDLTMRLADEAGKLDARGKRLDSKGFTDPNLSLRQKELRLYELADRMSEVAQQKFGQENMAEVVQKSTQSPSVRARNRKKEKP